MYFQRSVITFGLVYVHQGVVGCRGNGVWQLSKVLQGLWVAGDMQWYSHCCTQILQRASLNRAQMHHFHYFGTLMFLPTLHSLPSSNPRLIFDPLSQLGNTRVNPRLVPACTALAPAHDAGLEPLPALLEAHQGSTRVSLMITAEVSHRENWMWENCGSAWMSHLACVDPSG